MTVGWCCVCRCVRCRHHWRCQPHQPLSECSRGKKKHSARSTRSTFLSMIFVAPSRFSCFVREHRPVSIHFLRILFRHIFFRSDDFVVSHSHSRLNHSHRCDVAFIAIGVRCAFAARLCCVEKVCSDFRSCFAIQIDSFERSQAFGRRVR